MVSGFLFINGICSKSGRPKLKLYRMLLAQQVDQLAAGNASFKAEIRPELSLQYETKIPKGAG